MDDIDKKAWEILFKRAGKTLCYLIGAAVFGYSVFYLVGIVRKSEYAEIAMSVGFVGIIAFVLWVLILNWKDNIRNELLLKMDH